DGQINLPVSFDFGYLPLHPEVDMAAAIILDKLCNVSLKAFYCVSAGLHDSFLSFLCLSSYCLYYSKKALICQCLFENFMNRSTKRLYYLMTLFHLAYIP